MLMLQCPPHGRRRRRIMMERRPVPVSSLDRGRERADRLGKQWAAHREVASMRPVNEPECVKRVDGRCREPMFGRSFLEREPTQHSGALRVKVQHPVRDMRGDHLPGEGRREPPGGPGMHQTPGAYEFTQHHR